MRACVHTTSVGASAAQPTSSGRHPWPGPAGPPCPRLRPASCPPAPPQYERLGSEKHQASELRRVKSFLGLDPEQGGETMSVSNERKSKTQEAGWPMRREDYESLVALVRPDSVE